MNEPPLRHRASARVPANHPCLAGHFPGRPVVPAVLILELVMQAVQDWRGPHWTARRVLAAKFVAVLHPGQDFDIHLALAGTRVEFRCEHDARLLAHGGLEIAAAAPPGSGH